MKTVSKAIALSIVAIALSSCSAFTAKPTQTPTPTATSSPTSTSTPEPTATFTPYPTTAPTLTITPGIDINAVIQTATVEPRSNKLTYFVEITPGKAISVKVLIEGISQGQISFALQNGNSGSNINLAVSEVTATNITGEELAVTVNGTIWKITTGGNRILVLSYKIEGNQKDSDQEYGRNISTLTSEGAFFINQFIFAYPSDFQPLEIFIQFIAPPKWVVGTSFVPLGNNLYKVEGLPSMPSDFLQNVTRLGYAEAVESERCNSIEIVFTAYRPSQSGYEAFWLPSYQNTKQQQMHEYIQLVCASIVSFEEMFHGWPGGSRYWISTLPTGGNEIPMAWNRWMQAWPRERFSQIPHHVLHAWIWWEEDSLIRLGEPEWMWVQEGIPTYLGHQFSMAGSDKYNFRGMIYTSYLITKRAKVYNLLNKNTVNHYAYNEMRVLSLDNEIQRVTNGEKNIRDFLGLLGNKYGRPEHLITRYEVLQTLYELTGRDFSHFYSLYMTGEVSAQLPPVEDVIGNYENDFFIWLDQYISTDGRGADAKGFRTMFFISLEISLQKGEGVDSEHYVAEGNGIGNLDEFKQALLNKQSPITEEDVIQVLSSITGQDESDFFQFYTIGNFKTSVEEIELWLDASR